MCPPRSASFFPTPRRLLPRSPNAYEFCAFFILDFFFVFLGCQSVVFACRSIDVFSTLFLYVPCFNSTALMFIIANFPKSFVVISFSLFFSYVSILLDSNIDYKWMLYCSLLTWTCFVYLCVLWDFPFVGNGNFIGLSVWCMDNCVCVCVLKPNFWW